MNEGSTYTLRLAPGLAYTIDWGDGTLVAQAFFPSLTGVFTHLYADNPVGGNLVQIHATGIDPVTGATTFQVMAVTVDNVAPTIALSGAASAQVGTAYTLNLGPITDPGADAVTSRTINWGDGTTQLVASGGSFVHTYASGGSKTISVDLVDEDGTFASAGSLAVNVGSAYRVTLGTAGNDTLTGDTLGVADDWMMGLGGNDNLRGLGGNDVLFGNTGRDTLVGGDGNDHLAGNAGADLLNGGAGNDHLSGGAGSDRYVFGIGDAQDVINEALATAGWDADLFDSASGAVYAVGNGDLPGSFDIDVLALQPGVTTANLKPSRVGDSLLLTIGGSADQLQISGYFADGTQTIETIVFASGASWAPKDVRKMVIAPTAGDDTIIGYRSGDKLSGLAGNDVIDGREGDDTLAGGDGTDRLTGGSGKDRFVFDSAGALRAADLITDFVPGVDKIVLSAAIFSKLRDGQSIDPDSNRYLDYDAASGALSYDADGVNTTPGVTIAILGQTTHPAWLGADILVGP